MSYIEANDFVNNDVPLQKKIKIKVTYTAAWVVYVFEDFILTELRPGPLALRTVVKSVRRMKESEDAKVRF